MQMITPRFYVMTKTGKFHVVFIDIHSVAAPCSVFNCDEHESAISLCESLNRSLEVAQDQAGPF